MLTLEIVKKIMKKEYIAIDYYFKNPSKTMLQSVVAPPLSDDPCSVHL